MEDLDALTPEQLRQAVEDYDREIQRFDVSPSDRDLLGWVTVCCLIVNRTVGSGIFTVPARVLSATGSPGASLLIWTAGGIIMICATCCWLELSFTIPLRTVVDRELGRIRVSALRSGGEKNFLEYIYKRPRYFMTCVYGIMFIILGNISGNAIAFGMHVLIAAGRDPYGDVNRRYHKPAVLGLAVLSLTVCAAVHIFSRRGGIYINNTFAFLKVSMVLTITLLGFHHSATRSLGKGFDGVLDPGHVGDLWPINGTMIANAPDMNLHDGSFSGASRAGDLGSYVESFLVVLFCSTGFEQPFYILSEVRTPHRVFPKTVICCSFFTMTLYVLVNIAYFCVIPKYVYLQHPSSAAADIAGTFFHILFDSKFGPDKAKRAMAGLTAFSIFGNILVMTFTAARVKQEIAKEGILPFSLFFASGSTTPWAKWRSRSRRRNRNADALVVEGVDINEPLEQSPIAALGLHYLSSLFLIAITAWLKKPSQMYGFLITLYSFTNSCVVGTLVSAGLMYLKIDAWIGRHDDPDENPKSGRRYWDRKVAWLPWLNPLPQITFFLASTFFLFAAFVPSKENSPFHSKYIGYPTWLVPTIGIASLGLGMIWWLGLLGVERRNKVQLIVHRLPFLVRDNDGKHRQTVELVTHEWVEFIQEHDIERRIRPPQTTLVDGNR